MLKDRYGNPITPLCTKCNENRVNKEEDLLCKKCSAKNKRNEYVRTRYKKTQAYKNQLIRQRKQYEEGNSWIHRNKDRYRAKRLAKQRQEPQRKRSAIYIREEHPRKRKKDKKINRRVMKMYHNPYNICDNRIKNRSHCRCMKHQVMRNKIKSAVKNDLYPMWIERDKIIVTRYYIILRKITDRGTPYSIGYLSSVAYEYFASLQLNQNGRPVANTYKSREDAEEEYLRYLKYKPDDVYPHITQRNEYLLNK